MERPEHELLLACARVCPESDRSALMRSLLQRRIDWDYLLEIADASRMSSMLYRRLYSIRKEQVPSSVLNRLQEHYLMRSARNLFLTTELLRILDLFSKEGIPAIPFKGPVLAAALYEEPALREFNDLDILVPKQHAFRALRLLTALGYPSIPDFSPEVEFHILKQDLHYHILKETGNIAVELHWNLVPAYFRLPLPIDSWWTRTESASFENRKITGFAREDLLMVLSIQGCKHMWAFIQWIGDFARFLDRNADLDWDCVLRNNSPDLNHILFTALIVAHETLDAALPKQILEKAMLDSGAVALAREARARLFETGGKRQLLFYQFRLKPTWTGRLACFLSYLFTPLLIDYQTSLPRFLYPFYRPFRLLVGLCRRNPDAA